ncbi:hypothetical protein CC85DRAFT_305403 [Cutaneotrichosporon oleaginosum]|uniref:Phosphoesterase HXTX domain-containing protein n=1 Tax=Cutaneotrichosporon oleaginosum TaxID=879819 RepID=A0A0J0XDC6_9TREE|nr:uncharacterized protein CC85DRAFT_305403 [Cutaneotrichosporon oleaginosum]KLT39062.1 hypothetical protein CC85DRAFT_305403 [Cutaneotrichosporon oleaginosum]TXT11845.1 hypothetical protein COLE_02255 [Cutaneotrichosporon oleaginosum]
MSTDRITESHMRLFFAVPLSPGLAARIAGWRDALRLPRVAAPVPASNMHITLAFLGDVPQETVPTLLRLGARVAARSARGDLVLDRVHCWRNGVLHLAPSATGERERRFRQRSNSGPPVKTPPSLNRFKRLSVSSRLSDEIVPLSMPSTAESSHCTSPVSPLSPIGGPPSPSPTETTLTSVSSTRSVDYPPNPLAVHALAAALAAELEAAGIGFDKREFSAHLTLARRAEQVRARARFRVPITSLVLYVSRTDDRGVAYTALGEWLLRGDGSARSSPGEGAGDGEEVSQEGAGSRRSSGCSDEVNEMDRLRRERQLIDAHAAIDEVNTALTRILGISESGPDPTRS